MTETPRDDDAPGWAIIALAGLMLGGLASLAVAGLIALAVSQQAGRAVLVYAMLPIGGAGYLWQLGLIARSRWKLRQDRPLR